MTINKVLVVGYGSIGKRHLKIVRLLLPEADIRVLTRVEPDYLEQGASGYFTDMQQALDFAPDIVVIANPASFHIQSALPFARSGANLLIEKPLAAHWNDMDEFRRVRDETGIAVLTGYNLRHLPSLNFFRDSIQQGVAGDIFSVRCEVGQYLPGWRPHADYRQSVSALKSLGGGVLLELSHELDYLTWLFGDAVWINAWLGQLSHLEIDVEDTAHITLGFEKAGVSKQIVASVNMDFMRHDATRSCVVIGERGTLKWDGIEHSVEFFAHGAETWRILHKQKPDRDESYINEWRYFIDCVLNKKQAVPSFEDGQKILRLVDAARKSAQLKKPIQIRH
jgi:predicted dehydrogenase